MKLCRVGAELFGVDGRIDGQTHMEKAIDTLFFIL
jgi:hypothetical protein